MSECKTCGHDPDDDDQYEYNYDETTLDDFSDEEIQDEYFSRFSDEEFLAEEIVNDINMKKNIKVKLIKLLQDMTGKLVLTTINTK